MGKNSPTAPVENKNENKKPFTFDFNEVNNIGGHCNLLKDFPLTKLVNNRKLNDNYKTLKVLIKSIDEDAELLNNRQQDLEKLRANKDATPEEKLTVIELAAELVKETKAHNKKTYDVFLYTILDSEFPKEREQFGKKNTTDQYGRPMEVEYIMSYLELIGTVIEATEIL